MHLHSARNNEEVEDDWHLNGGGQQKREQGDNVLLGEW